jgi:hypothetical protein
MRPILMMAHARDYSAAQKGQLSRASGFFITKCSVRVYLILILATYLRVFQINNREPDSGVR